MNHEKNKGGVSVRLQGPLLDDILKKSIEDTSKKEEHDGISEIGLHSRR